MQIKIASTTIDQNVQLASRPVDEATVQDYAEAIEGGAQFPPIVVFEDEGGRLWLADGLHRIEAHDQLGLPEIEADVRAGDREDAMVFAATANVTNGKPMSREEKREAGMRLLEMTNWSDKEIARRLAVSNVTVMRWRNNLSFTNVKDSTRTVTRNGITYEMDVANIGQHQMDTPPSPAETLLENVGEDAHEPVADNTAVELSNIISDAQQETLDGDEVSLKDQPLDAQAQTLARTLEMTEERKEVLKSCQGWMVAHLARTGVWKAHPDGYASIKQYLKGAGVQPRDVSTLTGFAEKVVPYCDEKEIEIDHLLTNEHWDKFRAGMAAIKAAIKEDDPDEIRGILIDVERAATASMITAKYRKPQEYQGKGTSLRINRKVIFVLVLGTDKVDPDDAGDKIARRLGGMINWGGLIVKEDPKDKSLFIQEVETGERWIAPPGYISLFDLVEAKNADD
ncbi:MAG: ParB N-terminal domain-containing protein [Chloroflexi bacterium]|nr:ParB N-terminal domain-containing protein [Chloroflexota bacterium]